MILADLPLMCPPLFPIKSIIIAIMIITTIAIMIITTIAIIIITTLFV